MNLIRNSLVSSLGSLGLRRHGGVGFEMRCWKFFSISNSMQFLKSKNSRLEGMEKREEAKTGRHTNDTTNYEGENIYEKNYNGAGSEIGQEPYSGFETASDRENEEYIKRNTNKRQYVPREKQEPFLNFQHYTSSLLKCYLYHNENSYIYVRGESGILDLIKKGLKPECVFVWHADVNSLDDSLNDFEIHVMRTEMFRLTGSNSVIGIFRQDDLNNIAKQNEPKVPITIICSHINDGHLVAELLTTAAGFGCERFVIMMGVDCFRIPTDFTNSLEEAMTVIDPNSKILVLSLDGLTDNTLLEVNQFHVMGSADSWETDKVVLIVTPKNINETCLGLELLGNAKYISFDLMNSGRKNFMWYLVLGELVREYRMKYPEQNSRNKKSTKSAEEERPYSGIKSESLRKISSPDRFPV